MLQLAWALVLLLNVATMLVFAFDKWRAGRPRGRVPERVLLWLIFLGGWIGAWLAMGWFRHKTTKQPFKSYAILWTFVTPFWALVWYTAHTFWPQ